MSEPIIRKHGGYRNLRSFQIAQLVYDLTLRFCNRYIDRRSRTHDQMVQAARSGVQNIAEGSQASGTSDKFEMKLTSVGRASLEELRLDYEDFLRQGRMEAWPVGDPRRADLIARRPKTADDVARWVVEMKKRGERGEFDGLGGQSGPGGQDINWSYPCLAANAALTLISVACSLLDRQLAAQAKAFEEKGGFTERLHRVRTARRK